MSVANLWPDFDLAAPPRGIRQILQEAGAGIKEKTNGLIEFVVQLVGDNDGDITFDCRLSVPSINYSYLLFRAQATARGFPVRVVWDGLNFNFMYPEAARTEEQLLQQLRTIFQSPEVREVVTNLISLTSG